MTESEIRDIDAIMARLPHRFPFLLVDRVLSVTPGQSIVALKNVSANEAHFAGHFPSYPIMPGVLVIEALAQAGGLLVWESAGESERMSVPYLVGIEKARCKMPVRPGDQIVLRADLLKRKRGLWCFHCTATVDDKVAVEAELYLMASGTRP